MTRRHVPLTAQLNRIFGAVILLTCVILSVFSYRMNMQAHIASQTAQSVLLLRTMAQSINAQMAQVEIIAQETAYDEDVISLLRMKRLPEQIVSIVATMDQKFQRTEAYLAGLGLDIVLLSEDDAAVESYNVIVHGSRLSEDPFYQAFLDSPEIAAWGLSTQTFPFSSAVLSESVEAIPYYYKVMVGLNARAGVVRCQVEAGKLFAALSEYEGSESLMVLSEAKPLFVHGDAADVPEQVRGESWQEDGKIYFAVGLDALDATLVMCTPYAAIQSLVMRDIVLSIGLIALSGIVLLLAARRVVTAVLRRLHALTDAVTAIPDGNYSVSLPEDGPDEVGQLARAFGSLIARVKEYYGALLHQEKDKRTAQAMALQYQINPHFLFNSLYWLQLQMEEQGVDPALTASIESLGRVLHYNVLGSREAMLSEEEEQIWAYVDFASATKDHQVSLAVDLPEVLRSARILRFTLQPLLENAIRHGYVPGEPLHLRVAFDAGFAGDRLEIAVHNDGRPMSQDQIAELQERLDAAALDGIPTADRRTGHGTALNNLARRLYLTYGDAAQISFESGPNGTCVRILLPLSICMRGGAVHEDPDRR